MNLLKGLTPDILAKHGLSWAHSPSNWESSSDGNGIRVTAATKTDYFRCPNDSIVIDNSPFLHLNATGDFVLRAHVVPAFKSTWDAGGLMIRQDNMHWVKLAFERTDLGTTAVVSVVTTGYSDDANGPNVAVEAVWLQAARVGEAISLHYSLDGQTWNMIRVFRFPQPSASSTLQVGISAQCPNGEKSIVEFKHFSCEQRTLKNPRSGS